MAKELDVGMKFIKYMLFIANFMFMMIGFLLISIGSTIKAIYADFELFMESHYFSPATLVIAIGVLIFFVALFGCVGAWKESTCLINLHACFLIVILILEISAAIAAYAMRSDIRYVLKRNMEYAVNFYSEDYPYYQYSWDFMQDRLHCCGVNSPDDWLELQSAATTTPSTDGSQANWTGPTSCCKDFEATGICSVIWSTGCLQSLTYLVSETAMLLGCGALAVAFIQFLGIVFSHMLAKAIRRIKTQGLVEQLQSRQQLYEQLARGQDEKVTPVLYTPASSDA